MTSKYDDIFGNFMEEIRDYEFAHLDEPNMTGQMRSWLHKSLSKPYIKRIFETYTNDKEIAEIEYTLKTPVDDESDKDFVEELLGKQMVVEWLEPKLKTTTLLNQMVFNSKESKWYNQKDHMAEVRSVKNETYNDVRAMLRDRGYIYNEYLGNTGNAST